MIDPDHVSRLAKGMVESGQAASLDEARSILAGYRLQLLVAADVVASEPWQAAAISIANAGKRAMHGGVEFLLEDDPPCAAAWGRGRPLSEAMVDLGSRPTEGLDPKVPTIVLGSPRTRPVGSRVIFARAAGWRGGVSFAPGALPGPAPNVLATTGAAAIAVSEAFQSLQGVAVAGEREFGVSFWRPGADWLLAEPDEPPLQWLPAAAWILGLGHLGQAYAWLIGLLPYSDPRKASFHLQDFDVIKVANRDTSLLYAGGEEGEPKARLVARRLEHLGFRTVIVERALNENQRLVPGEPTLALAGFDKVAPRRALSDVGFSKIVDAGLGGDPQSYCEMQIHELTGIDDSAEVWAPVRDDAAPDAAAAAFERLAAEGGDRCGHALLAGRSVATAFVGMLAAAYVLAAVVRPLHRGLRSGVSGTSFALIDYSLRAPDAGSYLEAGRIDRLPRFAVTEAHR